MTKLVEGPITVRERAVLELVANGQRNREIGRMLHVSEETVKSRVRSLLYKTRARNRAHLVAIGLRKGIIE